MFGEGGDGEGGGKGGVEEAEGAVSAGGEDVGGVGFRVSYIVEGVLGCVPEREKEGGEVVKLVGKYGVM